MVKVDLKAPYLVAALIFWVLFFARGVFPTGVYDLFLVAMVFLLFVFMKGEGDFRFMACLFFFMAIFYVLGFLSIIIESSPNWPVALKTLYLYFVPVLSAWGVFFMQKRMVEAWVRVLGVVLFVQCVAFVFLYLANASGFSFLDEVVYQRSGFIRLQGFMGSPNYFSISVVTTFFLYSILCYRFSVKKSFIFGFFFRLCVLASFSRAAIIAVLFYDFMSLLYRYRFSQYFKGGMVAFFVVALFFSMGGFFSDKGDKGRFEKIAGTLEYRLNDLSESGSGRFEIWSEAGVYLENSKYALLGVGPGQYFGMQDVDNQTHNSYIKLVVENGFLGFFVYFIWFFALVVVLVNRRMWVELQALLAVMLFAVGNDVFVTKGFALLVAVIVMLIAKGGGSGVGPRITEKV